MVNGNVDIVEWMLRLQLPSFLKPLDLASIETERSGWSIEVSGVICKPDCYAVHHQLCCNTRSILAARRPNVLCEQRLVH